MRGSNDSQNEDPSSGPGPSPGPHPQLPNVPSHSRAEDAELHLLAHTALTFQTSSNATSVITVSHMTEAEAMSIQTADMSAGWRTNIYGGSRPSQAPPPWNSQYIERLTTAAQQGGSITRAAQEFFQSTQLPSREIAIVPILT